MSGEQEPEQDGRHLLLGERLARLVRGVHQVCGEVVTGPGSTVLGKVLAVAPEGGHSFSGGHLFLVVGVTEQVPQPGQ